MTDDGEEMLGARVEVRGEPTWVVVSITNDDALVTMVRKDPLRGGGPDIRQVSVNLLLHAVKSGVARFLNA